MAGSNVQAYKDAIRKIAGSVDPHEWEKADWSEAVKLIDEDVLKDARTRGEEYLRDAFPDAQIGPVKSLPRVEEKRRCADRADGSSLPTFKIVCDLLRARVTTTVQGIQHRVHGVHKVGIRAGWPFYLRGGGRFGSQADDKRYKDIVQFAYIYIPELGHFAELQIMHPVAAYTFHVDSILRSLSNDTVPVSERPLDVWTDGLYQGMRDYLVAQANGDAPPRTADELQLLCQQVYTERGRLIPYPLLRFFEEIQREK